IAGGDEEPARQSIGRAADKPGDAEDDGDENKLQRQPHQPEVVDQGLWQGGRAEERQDDVQIIDVGRPQDAERQRRQRQKEQNWSQQDEQQASSHDGLSSLLASRMPAAANWP